MIDSLDIYEIDSNCRTDVYNPKKAVQNPNSFFDAIAKKQVEMMQKQHEEIKMKARFTVGPMDRHGGNAEEESRIDILKQIKIDAKRAKRKSNWDSVVKETHEQDKVWNPVPKGKRNEFADFL